MAPGLNHERHFIEVQYPWVIKLLVAAIAEVVTLVLVQPFRCQLVAVDEQFRKNISLEYETNLFLVNCYCRNLQPRTWHWMHRWWKAFLSAAYTWLELFSMWTNMSQVFSKTLSRCLPCTCTVYTFPLNYRRI